MQLLQVRVCRKGACPHTTVIYITKTVNPPLRSWVAAPMPFCFVTPALICRLLITNSCPRAVRLHLCAANHLDFNRTSASESWEGVFMGGLCGGAEGVEKWGSIAGGGGGVGEEGGGGV